MMRARDRLNNLLAAALGVAGAAVLGALALTRPLPRPLWLWAALAAAYAVLEYSAVEVSDRLLVSSSAMVAFAAAVAMGRDGGVLAAAAMSILTVFHPFYLRGRRWQPPVANFGQLVLSTTAAVGLLAALLPGGALTRGDIPRLLLASLPAALLYDWVNFRLVAFMTRRLHPERRLEPWSRLGSNHLAMVGLAVLGSLCGVSYLLAGPLVLPLIGLTFLAGHVGLASYARLRRANLDTVHGFVKAVEALDPYTRGHSDRVVHFAAITGQELALSPRAMERLRSASQLHDVGRLAVPSGLLRKTVPLTPQESAAMARHMRVVENLLAGIEVLAPVVGILEEVHQVAAGGKGGIEARVLAAADAFDGATASRSHQAALTQAQAFALLRSRAGALGREVVEALIAAVTRGGEVYGAPDAESAAEVERLVRERAIRA